MRPHRKQLSRQGEELVLGSSLCFLMLLTGAAIVEPFPSSAASREAISVAVAMVIAFGR